MHSLTSFPGSASPHPDCTHWQKKGLHTLEAWKQSNRASYVSFCNSLLTLHKNLIEKVCLKFKAIQTCPGLQLSILCIDDLMLRNTCLACTVLTCISLAVEVSCRFHPVLSQAFRWCQKKCAWCSFLAYWSYCWRVCR